MVTRGPNNSVVGSWNMIAVSEKRIFLVKLGFSRMCYLKRWSYPNVHPALLTRWSTCNYTNWSCPRFKALIDDKLLQQYITLDLGHSKNPNNNPVAEKAVQESENELLCQDPLGGRATDLTLAVATATSSSHIRSPGLSSRDMWI